jgi:hypothetical protein
MGLYDKSNKINIRLPEFKFDFDWRKFKYPAIGLAALLVVLFFAFSIAVMLQPKALEASLQPNPLDLAKDFDTYLTVTVNNVTDATASNVVVSVETEASDAISIFPKSRTIQTLGKGETRTLSPFAISPNTATEVYSGTYILTIRTAINGQNFEKQVALVLKAV